VLTTIVVNAEVALGSLLRHLYSNTQLAAVSIHLFAHAFKPSEALTKLLEVCRLLHASMLAEQHVVIQAFISRVVKQCAAGSRAPRLPAQFHGVAATPAWRVRSSLHRPGALCGSHGAARALLGELRRMR